MAKKKIATVIGKTAAGQLTGARVEVSYCDEYEEFTCRLWIHSTLKKNADYFTTDRQDAMESAAVMLKEAEKGEQQ